MTAEPAAAKASTATPEPTSRAADRERYIQVTRRATSVDTALQQTSDTLGSSDEIARLYTELANSFGSNDIEAVRLIYRALLRLRRSRTEILAEIARMEIGSRAQTAVVHTQSRPSALSASSGSEPRHNPESSREAHSPQQKDRNGSRLPRLNVQNLLRAPAACITPLGAMAGTAILITLMISAGATSSVPTREATAPSTQIPTTPFEPSPPQPIKTSGSAPAEPARTPEPDTAARHLRTEDVAAVRARGDVLLSTGDVTSSRLYYERAVAAGDAQAAIRLGATYDPVFLSQALLRNVRADRAIALAWYRRARDLGAAEAETLLRSIEAKSE